MNYITDFFMNNWREIVTFTTVIVVLAIYVFFVIRCANKPKVTKRRRESDYKPKINTDQERNNWLLDRFDEPH